MLVTADSLVQMFFGWEGVNTSYSADFWYQAFRHAAALKAFVVNRVGDFGFSLGIFGTFWCSGSYRSGDFDRLAGMAGSTIGFAGMRVDTMTLLCLLLFVGAMGKCPARPSGTWLPDAMEARPG
jgi:NADH-quinone oxidoreductase subunit L